MKDPDAPFYIAVNNVSMKSKPSNSEKCWFKCNAVGTNKFGGLMKEMAKKAGLQNDKLRNHSARKTMIQTLSENNVPPTQIAQLSGHKNLKSIENYSHLSTKQQMHMSNVLANISSECSSITPFTPTVTPSTSAVFRPEGACRFSNPGQQSMALFSGAVIHGGQFSVTINTVNQSPPLPPPSEKRQWKRIRVSSDSDDD